MSDEIVDIPIGPSTQYILSTSGRPSSMRRYAYLLRRLLDVDMAYLPINNAEGEDDKKINAKHFCAAIRGLRAVGGAISKDIKGTVIAELDAVDPLAAAIGAVNTVVRRGDALHGYNTDAEGFEIAMSAGLRGDGSADPLTGIITIDTAVVYGYGGVTNVAVRVLQKMGVATVAITGRRGEMAKERAESLGVPLFDRLVHRPQLFVNAAPVTDAPLGNAEGFLGALRGCRVVFDHELVGAALVAHCRTEKVRHVPGTAMYWPQMERQWALFLAGRVPTAKLERLGALLREADDAVQQQQGKM